MDDIYFRSFDFLSFEFLSFEFLSLEFPFLVGVAAGAHTGAVGTTTQVGTGAVG